MNKSWIFLSTFLVIYASFVYSKPEFVRVTFDTDAAHSVHIAWNTNSPGSPGFVEYGPTKNYGKMVKATITMGNGALKAIHEAIIQGLQPDTVYHYRVGDAGDWSTDYTFRTPPEDVCTPYSFVALGDNRSDNSYGPSNKWPNILKESIEQDPKTGLPPLFVLQTGDIVHNGDDPDQWVNFLNASSPMIANVPLMPAMGNHDKGPGVGDSANYNQVFSLPRNDVTQTEDFYYFTFANAIVAVLSTETYSDGNPKWSKQANWLDKVLTEHPKMWKFVIFHKPCYTAHKKVLGVNVGHPPNEVGQNPEFTRVFDKHHVDIVFNGHNHWYQRIGPLKGNGDSDQGIPVDDPSKGTIYIITGGAGATTYLGIANLNAFCKTAKGSKKCSDRHHFVRITINYNHLHAEVWATKQQATSNSNSNRKLIDSFDIVKEVNNNPCESANSDGADIPPDSDQDAFVSADVLDKDAIEIKDSAEDTNDESEHFDGYEVIDGINYEDIFDNEPDEICMTLIDEGVDLSGYDENDSDDITIDLIEHSKEVQEITQKDLIQKDLFKSDNANNQSSPAGGCDVTPYSNNPSYILILFVLIGLSLFKLHDTTIS